NTSSSSHTINYLYYTMGNGDTLWNSNPLFTYPNSGSTNITLFTSNNVGCAENFVFTDFVTLQEPLAAITPSAASGCVPLLITFNNTSSVQGNGVQLDSFDWIFEDGTSLTTTGNSQDPTYNFTETGTF